jgi:5-methylcytosine-specific restriction endonuclease McrA
VTVPPSGDLVDVLRVYDRPDDEIGADGYPVEWHRLPEGWLLEWSSGIGVHEYPPGERMGVKHVVRAEAGHRCVRCLHPYRPWEARGEWTPCDDQCTHRTGGALRVHTADGDFHHETGSYPLELLEGPDVARVEAQWRILTVHHLRTGTEAKRDLRWWNLAALCQRCHLTIQGKVQMDRVWPWPHTPWFRPYAAGFYAWRYLGLELTRFETMQRLDELLALESMTTEAPNAG